MNTQKLSQNDIDEMLGSLQGWVLREGKLFREFTFRKFPEAFGFMASVATVAESMDHHPDWLNSYNKVEICLMSHDVQGLSERDFVLARRINELYKE